MSIPQEISLSLPSVIIIIQMGGVQSQQNLQFIFEDYQLIREQGLLKILEDKTTEQTFALRQQCFVNRKEYDLCFKKLTNRDESHECENILRLTKLWSKEHNGVCSNLFKIYSVYEFPRVKLIDEIEARNKEKKYFEEVELYSILQSCVNALIFEPRYVNISPNIIFIIPEGVLKLVHIDLMDPNLRSVYNPNYYYSPEKIEYFQNENLQTSIRLEKQSIFCLGMTILHSALLQNPNFCYEISNKRLNRKKLENLQAQLTTMYSESFNEMLAQMLEFNPNKRINFQELQTYINSFFNEQSVIMKESTKEGEGKSFCEQGKLQITLKRLSSEKKNRQPSSSLVYSGDTFFRAPSANYRTETNTKNVKKSEIELMMQLSNSENASIPKSHYVLDRTKKSKVKQMEEKQNDQIQRSLVDTQRYFATAQQNIVASKDHLSEYEFISGQKDRCVFVIQSYEDNSRYEGMMQNNLKNGYGKLIYQDGVYYQGNFKNDCIHGKGTLFYGPNRPAYSGDWVNNKFNGKGSLYNEFPTPCSNPFDYSNFNKIEESWVKFQGISSVIIGNFANDIKEGQGKIFLTNGQTMEGIFTKGLLNGQGTFTDMQGKALKGIWTNNILSLLY